MKDSKRQWSEDEDAMLRSAIESVVQRTGRTASACIGRMTRLYIRRGAGSPHWREHEDERLLVHLRDHRFGPVPRGTWLSVARDLDRTRAAVIRRASFLRGLLRSG